MHLADTFIQSDLQAIHFYYFLLFDTSEIKFSVLQIFIVQVPKFKCTPSQVLQHF